MVRVAESRAINRKLGAITKGRFSQALDRIEVPTHDWFHSKKNDKIYHYDDGSEFSYHNYVDGQWADYSLGFIYGIKHNKQLGYFLEGKYNRYWNRTWYDFKLGMNYVIF